MFRLIQDWILKELGLDLTDIHLWNIIEMYFVYYLIQYLSQWCYVVRRNRVYIASRNEWLCESRKLSANIVKTEV